MKLKRNIEKMEGKRKMKKNKRERERERDRWVSFKPTGQRGTVLTAGCSGAENFQHKKKENEKKLRKI